MRLATLKYLFAAHIEAAVRIVGCVCDANGSMTLDWEEMNGEDCLALQNWMFNGHTMDQEHFDMVDANGDGEIDGDEAAAAAEAAFEEYGSK